MVTIETHQFTIGSSAGCDLILDHPSISRAHVKIYFNGESILIEDLHSEKGTFVFHHGEFKRIKTAKVRPETKIRLGSELDAREVRDLINEYQKKKEKDKYDIVKKVRSEGLKRCRECGSVMAKSKVHCDCCGAVFDG